LRQKHDPQFSEKKYTFESLGDVQRQIGITRIEIQKWLNHITRHPSSTPKGLYYRRRLRGSRMMKEKLDRLAEKFERQNENTPRQRHTFRSRKSYNVRTLRDVLRRLKVNRGEIKELENKKLEITGVSRTKITKRLQNLYKFK
jgi:hypothetical protein